MPRSERPAPARPPDVAEIVIEAGRTERQYWKDLWLYRELFYFLSWRDIVVRYKQTAIGLTWTIVRPLLMMLVFTVVFGKIAKLPSGGVPYTIIVFSALLPWQFFASALTEASNSLIVNANLVSKVYFPRMIVPASAVLTSLTDLLVSAGIMALLMAWYRFEPSLRILVLPVFVAIAFAVALGTGLWMTALNVKYRDFRYVVPFMVQIGLYASPVGYVSGVVPEKWRLVYSLNPMVGVIDGFRWAILGGDNTLYGPGLACGLLVTAATLASGIWYFRKAERSFADFI